jgi:hypothetical protein
MGCRRRHFRVLELDGETVSVIYPRVHNPFNFAQATGNGRTVRTWNAIDIGSSDPPTVLAGNADNHAQPAERRSDEFGS